MIDLFDEIFIYLEVSIYLSVFLIIQAITSGSLEFTQY